MGSVDHDLCGRHKSEIFEEFKEFKNEIEKYGWHKQWKTIRLDRDGNCLCQEFDNSGS